jgi:hypothetical protein
MGTRGFLPREQVTVSFPVGVEAPSGMPTDERKVFDESVGWLVDAGTPPQEPDVLELARLARFTCAEKRLFNVLEKALWMVDTRDGNSKAHPAVVGWRAMQAACMEIEHRFGFNPMGRTRLPKSKSTGKSENPLAAHLRGNGEAV